MAKLAGAIAGARIVGERFVHSQRQQNPEGRPAPIPEEAPRVVCTATMRAAAASSRLR
jgi:hypothetical protein